MNLPPAALLVILVLSMITSGCASLESAPGSTEASSRAAQMPMDQIQLEEIFADQVEAITGPSGALQTQIDGISVYCISDPANDRMRLLAPISRLSSLRPRAFEILLRANFNSTLDARYAISDDVVWAAYLHPISTLTPEMIVSGIDQVVSLVKTFGTSFSSGELDFGVPEGDTEGVESAPSDANSLP